MAAAAVLSGAAQPEPRHAPCVAPAFAAGRQGSGGNRDRFVFVLVNVWADNSIRVLSGHSITSTGTHTTAGRGAGELECGDPASPPLFIHIFPNT